MTVSRLVLIGMLVMSALVGCRSMETAPTGFSAANPPSTHVDSSTYSETPPATAVTIARAIDEGDRNRGPAEANKLPNASNASSYASYGTMRDISLGSESLSCTSGCCGS